MKAYLGVKQVMAVDMMFLAAQEVLGRDVGYTGATDEKGDADGYLVQYPDGYQAWSPKEVFDAHYRQTDCLSFGLALEALKKGLKVARQGWNGKDMWLCLQVPDAHSKMSLPYIYMFTACKNQVPWLASQADMLSDDWVIVD